MIFNFVEIKNPGPAGLDQVLHLLVMSPQAPSSWNISTVCLCLL